MTNGINRIYGIAQLTFTEAVRQKFFYVVLLMGVGMLLGAGFFQQFDFGTEELKFIIDFGFGIIFLLGSIMAITASAQLFFNELENRTVHTLLAKPVRHYEFIVGKFIGIQLLMLAFVAVMCALLTILLVFRESSLMAITGEAYGNLVRYGDVTLFGLTQWARFGVLCGITLFIGSFARSYLLTLMLAFMVMLIGQLQYLAHDGYAAGSSFLIRWLFEVVILIFPNLQLFNVGDQLGVLSAVGISWITLAQLLVYASAYCGAYLVLAWWNFRNREL